MQTTLLVRDIDKSTCTAIHIKCTMALLTERDRDRDNEQAWIRGSHTASMNAVMMSCFESGDVHDQPHKLGSS